MTFDAVIYDVVGVDVGKGAWRRVITMTAVALDRSGTVGWVEYNVGQTRSYRIATVVTPSAHEINFQRGFSAQASTASQ